MSSSEPRDSLSPPSAQPRTFGFIEDRDDPFLVKETSPLASSSSLSSSSSSISAKHQYDSELEDDADDLSDPPDPDRPNKRSRSAVNWLEQFDDEVTLSKSIDKLRSQDLAVHLYDVHRLNVCAKTQRNAHVGTKSKFEAVWGPQSTWTAWPLPPHRVPREREESNQHWDASADTAFTIRSPDTPHGPREVLEEILIGLVAKKARARFAARQFEESEPPDSTIGKLESNPGSQSDSDSQEQPDDSHAGEDKPSTDAEVVDQVPITLVKPPKGTFLVEEAHLRPAPLSDEDHITALLQRPVRHALTQFDALLTTLHQARKAVTRAEDHTQNKSTWKRRGRGWSSGEEASSDENAVTSEREHSKKRKRSPDGQAAEEAGETGDESQNKQPKRIKTWAHSAAWSRKRKYQEDKYRRPYQQRERHRDQRAHAKLMDWSQVLGFAALAGLPAGAVQRARGRCEQLFNQRMDFVGPVRANLEVSEDDQVDEGAEDDQHHIDVDRQQTFLSHIVESRAASEAPPEEAESSSRAARTTSPSPPPPVHKPRFYFKTDLQQQLASARGPRMQAEAQGLQHGVHTDWWAGSGPLHRQKRWKTWDPESRVGAAKKSAPRKRDKTAVSQMAVRPAASAEPVQEVTGEPMQEETAQGEP